ncbi:MAG: folate family ECF transporter S component [Oscillospiraceae bacterium]|nr:folate family ECF transporter S component [Oscillospiraceae bacterium]
MVLHTIKEKLQELVRRLAASAQELHRVPSLTAAAMLAAVALVLNQFTIAVSQFLEIGFTFLAAGVCAFLFGPWMAGLMGIVTDLIGYFLRPNGGFFPGFTLNEFLLGFLYGCWLYKKPPSWRRTFAACLSAVLIINLFLTPLWLNMLYGQALFLSSTRLIKNALKLPLDASLLYLLLKALNRRKR